MRVSIVILPDDRWSKTRERWLRAEELGFDHGWTYDHLTWRELQDKPWFGSIPTLTAAACVTRRMRLGTLVASPNFRHPVPFAKELMTLDDLSEGRLSIGLGAGGDGFDATALGQEPWTPAARADRFAAFVALLDRLLVQEQTNETGEFFSANEARALPGCFQKPRPPFVMAGGGPRGMRLAAEHASSWVAVDGRDATRESVEKLRAVCEREGREFESIGRLALLGFLANPLASREAFLESVERYDEMGFTGIAVHWPREADPFKADLRVLEEIADDVGALNGAD